jgi:hypothetical protein
MRGAFIVMLALPPERALPPLKTSSKTRSISRCS